MNGWMLLGLVWVPICSPETVVGVTEATRSGMWPSVEMPSAISPVSRSLSGQMREKNPQAPSGLKPCVLLRIPNIGDNWKKCHFLSSWETSVEKVLCNFDYPTVQFVEESRENGQLPPPLFIDIMGCLASSLHGPNSESLCCMFEYIE